MSNTDREHYTDFSNVETEKNFLTAEEFPEGPYGAPVGQTKPVQNKETPWKEGQQFYSNFTYENRKLHEGLPRQMEGAHPTHDGKDGSEGSIYNQNKTAKEK